jgi:hypothetical protein
LAGARPAILCNRQRPGNQSERDAAEAIKWWNRSHETGKNGKESGNQNPAPELQIGQLHERMEADF